MPFFNGYFDKNREDQSVYWMHETIENKIKSQFYHSHKIENKLNEFITLLKDKKISSFSAANQLVNIYNENK